MISAALVGIDGVKIVQQILTAPCRIYFFLNFVEIQSARTIGILFLETLKNLLGQTAENR